MIRSIRLAGAVVAVLGLAACDNMTQTQQRTGVGALGGGAVGGLLGSFSGNAGLGALLGAGVGGAGGYLYDQSERQRSDAYRSGYRYREQRR
jgi:uncharacterized membrane protein